MNSEHVEDLVDLEAVGALSPEESAFLRAHVADCARCRASLDEAEATAARLALLSPMHRAPSELRGRVMAEVQRSGASAPLALPGAARTPTPLMRFNRKWGAMAAMLFLLPLGGLLGWNFLLQTEVNDLKQESRQIQETQRDVVLLALPTTVRARFTPTQDAGTAQGTVSWNPDVGQCQVVVRGLPVEEGVSYRVFYQGMRGVVDAGELRPDESGGAALTFDVKKWQGAEYQVWVAALRPGTEQATALLQAELRRQ